jgi:hypothetical protein
MAWRFVLDGEDVSSVAMDKQASRELGAASLAQCKIPSFELADVAGFDVGTSRLKVYDDANVLWHHGIVWHVADDGDENTAYSVIQSTDPSFLWAARPARDADGDFSYPGFLTTQSSGPQILAYVLANSVTHEGPLLVDLSGGTVATGGVDLSGTPVDYPITIADLYASLIQTGMLDVILEPIEGTTEIARFNAYNGDYGSDLSGSVVFQYGTGLNNVRRVRRTLSMATMRNKLWYFLGPKKQTIDDPDATQHWRSNVTGDHPSLPNPPGGDVDDLDPLGTLIANSRATYWTAMEIRTFDSALDSGTEAVDAQLGTDALYLRLWQAEQTARVGPREIIKVTPVRGTEPNFTIGDRIGVEAGTVLRGGFSSGTQRVYKITVLIDNNGVVDLGEIQTSGDQEVV